MDLDELQRVAKAAGSTLDADDERRLLAYLIELGASRDELVAAIERHNVGDLALELALREGTPRPFAEVAVEMGLEPTEAARYWRAMGFPDPVQHELLLPEDATRAFQLLMAGRELLGDEAALALARVIGASAARIAQAVLDTFRAQFEAPQLAAGLPYSEVVEQYTVLGRDLLPQLGQAVGAVMLRHLVAMSASAWSGDAEGGGSQQDLAVGFADMTGYTALSRSLSARELTEVISAFEEAVTDAASHHGGRVVKLLGDGAMFSAGDAERACHIGRAVLDRAAASGRLPSVRAGIAAGPVVNLGGDMFGPVVNLAARLAAAAPEGSVVVDGEVRSRAGDGLAFDELPLQELKGVGAPALAYRLV